MDRLMKFLFLAGLLAGVSVGISWAGTTVIDGGFQVTSRWYPVEHLDVDGAQCTYNDPGPLTMGNIQASIDCAANDAGRITGVHGMPDSWDGGALTYTLYINQSAADTNDFKIHFAANCYGNDEATAPFSTANEVPLTITLVTADDLRFKSTNPVTPVSPVGNCEGGDFLIWQANVDAAGTTSTALTTLHIIGIRMEYVENPSVN